MKCALTGHRVLERNFSCAALEEKCRELFQNNLMCQKIQQQEQSVPLVPNM